MIQILLKNKNEIINQQQNCYELLRHLTCILHTGHYVVNVSTSLGYSKTFTTSKPEQIQKSVKPKFTYSRQ